MSPRPITSLEELKALVGVELGPTDWHEVTQEQVNLFADATGDHQWIHVDVERAKESTFGGTIAHGFFTLSRIPASARELFSIEIGTSRLNYGVDSVRFPSPLRVGVRTRTRAVIESVEETAKGVRFTTAYTLEGEGSERPVCVAKHISLITGIS